MINSYAQNGEDRIIKHYFGEFIGNVLDIGANDGITFSNSRMFIENGWNAHLIEPSTYGYQQLLKIYNFGLDRVKVRHSAITNEDGMSVLLESGAHVPHGRDRALVSTFKGEEANKWGNVHFEPVKVPTETFATFYEAVFMPYFDFITIDAEGFDWDILQQIDLSVTKTKCLCIEWNSKPELAKLYTAYCARFGLKEIHRNAENIIYAA